MINPTHIQIELAVKGSQIGVWDWNFKSDIAFIDEQWAKLIGYKVDELRPLNFKTWSSIIHPEDMKKSREQIDQVFKEEKIYYDLACRLKHKNGNWVWIHSKGKVFEWDEDGQPKRMCGIHQDISKQKETELRLTKALEEKNLLIQEIHHRVKNNLQILLNLTQLKSKSGLVKTAEMISVIQSISEAYQAIYHHKNLTKIALGEHIKEVLKPMQKNLHFNLNIQAEPYFEEINFLVPIGLIMSELVHNSIKHSNKNGENLDISISVSCKKNRLKLNYQDNGQGFKNEVIENKSTKSFGLLIIKSLSKQLNGNVKFYNLNGACTEISIPS